MSNNIVSSLRELADTALATAAALEAGDVSGRRHGPRNCGRWRHAVLLRQRRERRRRAASRHGVRRALHARAAGGGGDRAHHRHVAPHRHRQRSGLRPGFARQIEALARPGDLLDHSLHERRLAQRAACGRVGAACGSEGSRVFARDGGALRTLADLTIVIPTQRTDRAQELHMCIEHAICELIEREL